jgi:hypothetical protein
MSTVSSNVIYPFNPTSKVEQVTLIVAPPMKPGTYKVEGVAITSF